MTTEVWMLDEKERTQLFVRIVRVRPMPGEEFGSRPIFFVSLGQPLASNFRKVACETQYSGRPEGMRRVKKMRGMYV
jgi:hypothetical protein